MAPGQRYRTDRDQVPYKKLLSMDKEQEYKNDEEWNEER